MLRTAAPTSRSATRTRLGSRHDRGFTLVELMVALVVGLIVTLAAVSFVVSIASANSKGIQVTRLTQELRSLSEVMSREIRRAQYAQDPIQYVNQGGTGAPAALSPTPGNTASCISLQYDVPDGARVTHSIYLNSGRVYMSDNMTCTGGTQISTEAVIVDTLSFTAVNAFQIDQRIRGRLRDAPPDLVNVPREFIQTVFVRSGPVN